MYNPFGTVTMKRVLERIMRSYTKNKRIITVIYKNPIFHKLIIETGIFHKISEFNTEDNFKFFVYRTE